VTAVHRSSGAFRIVLFAALYCSAPAWSAEESPGAWGILVVTAPIESADGETRWDVTLNAEARYFDLGSGVNQWLARPSVGYRFAGGAMLRLGYARFRTTSARGVIANENRPWQEIFYQTRGRRYFVFRGRLEQRFVDVGDDPSHVLRALAGYRQPIGKSRFRLEALYETFETLNDADWVGPARQVQWRFGLGASYPVSDRTRLTVGYLYQEFDRIGRPDLGNHILALRVASTLTR
jgi:hypothetical protein